MYFTPPSKASVTRGKSPQSSCPWHDHPVIGEGWLVLLGLPVLSIAAYAIYRKRRRKLTQSSAVVESPRQLEGTLPADSNEGTSTRSKLLPSRRATEELNGKTPALRRSFNSGSLWDTYTWNSQAVDIGAALGVDIGGTLSKLVYFEKKAPSEAEARGRPSDPMGEKVEMKRTKSLSNLHGTTEQLKALKEFYFFMDQASLLGETGVRDSHLSVYSHALGGALHFFHFETRRMNDALGIIRNSQVHHNIQAVGCTGGGAFKFEQSFLERLGVKMLQMDEMECLVRGMQFALASIPNECYTYRPPPEDDLRHDSEGVFEGETEGEGCAGMENSDSGRAKDNLRNKRMRHMAEASMKLEYTVKVGRAIADDPASKAYPALVVSLGSGVSIIKVDGPAQFKRVSGSSIGGGTYWGLCRLLTKASTYDESLAMAKKGESDKADMLVGDIYGRGYSKFQLSSKTLASSFGKIGGMSSPKSPTSGVSENDLAKSLLVMITMNIGQVAYLNARLFSTRRIYFVGNFLRQNHLSGQQLAFAIDYWSSGEMEALFLEHEGYCGALGSFLMSGTEEPPTPTRSSDTGGD